MMNDKICQKCNKKAILLVAVGILLFAAGYFLHGFWPGPQEAAVQQAEAQTEWTCSMHPQIREDKPGKCRLCDMDLTPLVPDASSMSTLFVLLPVEQ
ncbi:MAG: heavy metal-binding domain-containing protein, partial [Planctomycetota bacterium]